MQYVKCNGVLPDLLPLTSARGARMQLFWSLTLEKVDIFVNALLVIFPLGSCLAYVNDVTLVSSGT